MPESCIPCRVVLWQLVHLCWHGIALVLLDKLHLTIAFTQKRLGGSRARAEKGCHAVGEFIAVLIVGGRKICNSILIALVWIEGFLHHVAQFCGDCLGMAMDKEDGDILENPACFCQVNVGLHPLARPALQVAHGMLT